MSNLTDKRVDYLKENVGFDYILEVREGNRFIEVVNVTGGDVRTHRVYGDNPDNFMITER